MNGAHLKSGWINKAVIAMWAFGHSFLRSTQLNFDASWGPKWFWFFRDIWRSSDEPTKSLLPIEIYTIRYLAICKCSLLDSKPYLFLKLTKKRDICYINVTQNACFLGLPPAWGVCYLTPFGAWYCMQFSTWAKSFVEKFVKLAPICHEFEKKYEKWPKIACFWHVPREPAMCHLSPSGISKSTLFTAWARSFVSRSAKLAPGCPEFGKFFEFVWWSCLIPTPIKFNSENARSFNSCRISRYKQWSQDPMLTWLNLGLINLGTADAA